MSGEPAAVVHPPGGGERLGGGGSQVTVKAGGAATGGALYVGEAVVAPGFPGPPAHVHERMHDLFYVLEGTLALRIGREWRDMGPGSFACVPPGVVHTFANRGDAPARFLNIATPAGWEDYMRDLAAGLAAGTLSQEEIGGIASRYDFRPVSPG